MKADIIDFDDTIRTRGWALFPDAIPAGLVRELRRDSLKWIDVCAAHQIANKINLAGDGTGHNAIGGGDSIDAFIDLHLFHPYLSHFFSCKPYILHACNPVGGFPNLVNYVHRVHRDVATYIPMFNMRMNMLVMLDEFTIENGATRVLSGSHLMSEQPSDEEFERGSEPILGAAGSILLFNSYLWHKGTLNTTQENRVALTLSFGPAFIKPQMDYARMLGESRGRQLSELTRQLLGFNSRVPVSLAEWYKPKAERLYLPNQG